MLKDLIRQNPGNEAANIEKTIELMTKMLSVETINVLQVVGFNFKKAIGEPLTLLLRKAIESIALKIPTDPQSELEREKLLAILNTEALKVTQDKDASDRLERLRSKRFL